MARGSYGKLRVFVRHAFHSFARLMHSVRWSCAAQVPKPAGAKPVGMMGGGRAGGMGGMGGGYGRGNVGGGGFENGMGGGGMADMAAMSQMGGMGMGQMGGMGGYGMGTHLIPLSASLLVYLTHVSAVNSICVHGNAWQARIAMHCRATVCVMFM